jgi:predicted acetyltransferase
MMNNLNKDELYLLFPNIDFKKEYTDIRNEYKIYNEESMPYGLHCGYDIDEFDKVLKDTEDFSNNINLPEGKVGATTYWLMKKNNRKILGAINIRHSLNEFLINFGGHIGYGIRPTERKNGYATKMLNLSFEKCKKLNLNRVLITCDKKNIASARVILLNGGILENEIVKDGEIVQRYWIDL